MALEHELTALGATQDMRARDHGYQRALRRLRLAAEFESVRAYRALFLDEHGVLKAEAVAVIADLAAKARLGVADTPAMLEPQLREFAGRRAIALHVLARLDQSGVKMRDLARRMREAENE